MNVDTECWKITVLVTVPLYHISSFIYRNFSLIDFTTIFCIEIYNVVDINLWNIEKRFTLIV